MEKSSAIAIQARSAVAEDTRQLSALAEAGTREDAPGPVVSLRQFLLAYLYIGSTSIGGRSASYLLDELVHRRKWLRREDWMEGMALGLMLPGMVGNSCAMFLATLLRGPRAAALGLLLYSIPGLLVALGLSALIFDLGRPPWADRAIHALSASAFGLFLYVALRNVPATRKLLFGPAITALVFVTYGLIGVGLLPVLIGAGALSFLLNEATKAWRRAHDR